MKRIVFALLLAAAPAGAKTGYCSSTASLQFHACRNEVRDDHFTARAICTNVSDDAEREACLAEADEERDDGRSRCSDQYEARRALCADLGEERYEPAFDPILFDADFSNPTSPNPHFPLPIGGSWTYIGGDETVQIRVLDKTKFIDGVTCIVVNDVVSVGGAVVEDTDDWFGQAKDGTIHYCGESVRDYETFAGDDPAEAELVEIAGSFKAGRDGARSGVVFLAAPTAGAVYRQEWTAGEAEDAARVLSTTYDFGDDPVLDQFVPQALADLLCNNDCVVTAEFSPIQPGAYEHKYFAPGIGKFLEISPAAGDVVRLTACNVDPRCAMLPAP